MEPQGRASPLSAWYPVGNRRRVLAAVVRAVLGHRVVPVSLSDLCVVVGEGRSPRDRQPAEVLSVAAAKDLVVDHAALGIQGGRPGEPDARRFSARGLLG